MRLAAWRADRLRRLADTLCLTLTLISCARQWSEGVFGAARAFSATALSARAQLGIAAVSGSLLATDYEATRNHAWSDVKGKARPATRLVAFRVGYSCLSREGLIDSTEAVLLATDYRGRAQPCLEGHQGQGVAGAVASCKSTEAVRHSHPSASLPV